MSEKWTAKISFFNVFGTRTYCSRLSKHFTNLIRFCWLINVRASSRLKQKIKSSLTRYHLLNNEWKEVCVRFAAIISFFILKPSRWGFYPENISSQESFSTQFFIADWSLSELLYYRLSRMAAFCRARHRSQVGVIDQYPHTISFWKQKYIFLFQS